VCAVTWRLITIRFSHYNEKARWALDRCGHAYDEEPYLPFIHGLGTAPVLLRHGVGAADKGSSRFSTPVLIADGRVLTDSSDIVAFASERAADPRKQLYWTAEARELEAHYSGRFGGDARRVAYWYLLPQRELIVDLARRNAGPRQARVFALGFPLFVRLLRGALAIDEVQAMRSRDNVLAEFERVSERLADGRPYLLGDRFSAADISFAALGSIALMIGREEGFAAWLPRPDQLGAEFGAFAASLRETPAGKFVVRMFAKERGQRLRPCSVD
jgi:glutathione S-transferase